MKEFIDKLIERLEEHIETAKVEGDFTYIRPFEIAKNTVNQLAEEYKGGWIPCSERLPEEYCEVLVTAKHFEYAQTGFLKGGIWYADDNIKYLADSIIAWQPLPAPYQPKGE